MTLSDKLTRDQVRDAFNRNLTYADLCGIPRSAIADPAAYAAALAC